MPAPAKPAPRKAPAPKKAAPKVAIFVEELYNALEFWVPYYRLKEAGAAVVAAGPKRGGLYASKYGLPCIADAGFAELDPAEFAGLVIPGGYAPDRIRRSPEALAFCAAMDKARKPVAFICHAGWVPASAGILKGRACTSFPAIRDDLVNAGAAWVDKAVVVDKNLISSRTPDDLPAFCAALVKKLGLA